MPKMFLHVGLPKTATTTIQGFLLQNRDRLLRDGVLYPLAGLQGNAHHPLGNIFSEGKADWIDAADGGALQQALQAEVAASGCHTVIMSTESLAWVPRIEALKRWLDGFDTQIILYLRRQDEWLESAYQDNLKTGGTDLPPEAYLELRRPLLNLHDLVLRWAQCFGADRLRVVVFEKGGSPDTVEQTFLARLGLPYAPDYTPAVASNSGLGRDALAFLTAFRAERRIALRHWVYGDILRGWAKENPDPPEWKYVWSPAERRAIVESHAENNARIARDFCGREDGVLFRQPLPAEDEPWAPYPGLSTRRAVEIGEYLADQLFIQRQNARRERGRDAEAQT